jgi:hypothetical protein
MKTTIETNHRITIKGQMLDLTTAELQELYNAVAAALCKKQAIDLEEIRRLFYENQQRPAPVVPPLFWGDTKLPYEIPPVMCGVNKADSAVEATST